MPIPSSKATSMKPTPLPGNQFMGENVQSKSQAMGRAAPAGKPFTVAEIAEMGTVIIGETVEVCYSDKIIFFTNNGK